MLTSDLQTTELTIANGVARITLNRPGALNAWTPQLGKELRTALEEAAADPDARAIVFTGAGRAFSSGADLKEGGVFAPDGTLQVEQQLREIYHPLIARVRTVEKPVLAAVNGGAVGIGCSLALACDLILAAESAYFLLSFANIGLALDGGASLTLPARVGHARALEMSLLGERVPAETAREWGLVNEVVADDGLLDRATELAARLAAGAPGAYATIKRTINSHMYDRLDEVLDLEATLQQQRAGSKDFQEGVLAFLQKRPAKFTGQ